jgi:type IV secretory pathway VirB2 component (pilin)
MKIEKAELMAYILIVVGLLLLIFTFIMAFFMLTSVVSISTQMDLSNALGEILGPIAEAVIKIMFLGVMGWTGSIATMRGIQLYKESKPAVQPPKPEEKSSEKA